MILLAFGLLWLIGSTVLSSLGRIDYGLALLYNLFSYLPGLLVFIFFFLVSLVSPYHIYYPLRSFLFLGLGLSLGIVTILLIYLNRRYLNKCYTVVGWVSTQPSRAFIYVFISLMLISALLSISGHEVHAQRTATSGYVALVVGILLRSLELRKSKEL